MLTAYRDFDLHLFGHDPGVDGQTSLRVQVMQSPAGSRPQTETAVVPPALARDLVDLARGALDKSRPELIRIGRALAALMLPTHARELLRTSYKLLAPGEGLRLRLRCTGEGLDAYPWELAHLEEGVDGVGQADDARGFLALNRRLSLVRVQPGAPHASKPQHVASARRRVVAVMSDPPNGSPNQVRLDLGAELDNLRKALHGIEGFELVSDLEPTLDALHRTMTDGGAYCFHFAGHGEMQVDANDSRACLMLQGQDGTQDPITVDDLVLHLQDRGIQLAVLCACDSAMRNGRNAWASIAPSLVRAGIPSVLGMQYDVLDSSAVAFSHTLYRTWLQPKLLDEAVAEARLAIYNILGSGRDFATPVLYVHDGPAVLAGAEPPPPPRAAPEPIPRPLRADLDDHKRVHEALHVATTTEVRQMQELLKRPPRPAAEQALRNYLHQLRLHLDEVHKVAHHRPDEDDPLKAMADAFEAIYSDLKAATSSSERSQAMASLDTELFNSLTQTDAAMSALARQLPNGTPVPAVTCVTQPDPQMLRQRILLHGKCQRIHNTLHVIRRAAAKQRATELRGHWNRLQPLLGEVLEHTGWAPDAHEQVRQATQDIGNGVAARDETAMVQAFGTLCIDFDFGFRRVDADLKEVFRAMQQPGSAHL
jgi:hypothetical protein